jgi:flagellar assembly factor FliW
VNIETTRFGCIEIASEKVLTFSNGILGFPDLIEYILLDHSPGSSIRWLQAVQDPDVAFVVLDPLLFKFDYQVSLHQDDLHVLQAKDTSNLLVLVIITISPDRAVKMTANLKGPIVINLENHISIQAVLYESAYPTRFDIHASSSECRDQTTPEQLETTEVT